MVGDAIRQSRSVGQIFERDREPAILWTGHNQDGDVNLGLARSERGKVRKEFSPQQDVSYRVHIGVILNE